MDPTLETSARLLSLLQMRRSWSGIQLAEALSVTQRTVRRDIEKLRSLGYPVQATSGVAGGYRSSAGARLPPLLLDDEEALAVSIALRGATTGTVAGMEEVALRALDKLGQVLPARLGHRLDRWHDTVVTSPLAGPKIDPDRLLQLVRACDAHLMLRFDYRDRLGSESERTIEPHGLVHRHARWYLVAWDQGRSDWRTFRVDRILRDPRTGRSFVPRPLPHGDLASYVTHHMESQLTVCEARVEIDAPVRDLLERLPVSSCRLTPIGTERSLAEIRTHDSERLAVYLASLGVDFVVLDPAELFEAVRTLAHRLERSLTR